MLDKIEELEELLEEAGDIIGQIAMEKGGIEALEDCETMFTVDTPLGKFSIDYAQYERARHAVMLEKEMPTPLYERMVREFFGESSHSDSKYWSSNLGSLIKSHVDEFFADWHMFREFIIKDEILRDANYGNIEIGNKGSKRYMSIGTRFYISPTGERVVLTASQDSDGDQRIVVTTRHEGDALQLIEEFEHDFYQSGPLKGEFFDMDYNFIKRNDKIGELLAWNPAIRETLKRDVIDFIKVMPMLKEKGLPNSRGIILSGAPGTGKTMYAKALAAECDISTILISAEMINQRHDVRTAFEIARKLSPSLIIIEDIDTAGTVSRQFTDHPILGEYLQAMDGMSPNDGVVIIATTNHTQNIDPAISDRPGRFDRIIEVGLPEYAQREQILEKLLAKMPSSVRSGRVVKKLSKDTEGLSGAWIREVVQSALISAVSSGRKKINQTDLQDSIGDVLKRRGLAYKATPKLTDANNSAPGVYVG
ncbi:MAG: hypothetical protein CMB21_01245 [Euryarchaeota archaeon]|nr:hypothetical protein [Euryarchaeota archaeon]